MTELVQERTTQSKIIDGTARIGIAISSAVGTTLASNYATETLQSPLASSFAFAVGMGMAIYAMNIESSDKKKNRNLFEQIKDSSQNIKKLSMNKAVFFVGALIGYGVGVAELDRYQLQQQFAAEQAEIRKLPALDPSAPLQIAVNPRTQFCSSADNAVRKAIIVNHNGQKYHLQCGYNQ